MHQQNTSESYLGLVGGGGGAAASTLTFPAEVSQILPWTLPHPTHFSHDPFLIPSQPLSYGGLFNRRPSSGLQLGYDGVSSDHNHHHLRLMHPSAAAPFGLQAELQKMTAQEIMDAKALAASRSHSEAERRRRERINNHLAKLRSLLPNTTKIKGTSVVNIGQFDTIKRNHRAVEKLPWKILAAFAVKNYGKRNIKDMRQLSILTDKASLLAEVIQHVKELKRQTSLIAETTPVPSEIDELTVDNASDEDGTPLIKASICCDDRSDLLPDLIKTLKALKLRTLKAEITTLGGRVKNVLFITGDEDFMNNSNGDISSIEEALKAVMEKSNGDDQSGSGNVKRQRTNINLF